MYKFKKGNRYINQTVSDKYGREDWQYKAGQVIDNLCDTKSTDIDLWINAFDDFTATFCEYQCGPYDAFFDLVLDAQIPSGAHVPIITNISANCAVGEGIAYALQGSLNRETPEINKVRMDDLRTRLADHIDADGYITAYRGQTKHSKSWDKAVNFTVSKKVAQFFAGVWIKNSCPEGIVYTVKINIKDVVAYTTERDEAELIVIAQYVGGDIKLIDQEIYRAK